MPNPPDTPPPGYLEAIPQPGLKLQGVFQEVLEAHLPALTKPNMLGITFCYSPPKIPAKARKWLDRQALPTGEDVLLTLQDSFAFTTCGLRSSKHGLRVFEELDWALAMSLQHAELKKVIYSKEIKTDPFLNGMYGLAVLSGATRAFLSDLVPRMALALAPANSPSSFEEEATQIVKAVVNEHRIGIGGGLAKVYVSSAITPKLKKGAATYADLLKAEQILLLYDETVFGSGKKGLVFTDRGVHSSKSGFVPYSDVDWETVTQHRGVTGIFSASQDEFSHKVVKDLAALAMLSKAVRAFLYDLCERMRAADRRHAGREDLPDAPSLRRVADKALGAVVSASPGTLREVAEDALALAQAEIENMAGELESESEEPATESASSISEKIRELAQLRDEGLLSGEEFNKKKHELIERL